MRKVILLAVLVFGVLLGRADGALAGTRRIRTRKVWDPWKYSKIRKEDYDVLHEGVINVAAARREVYLQYNQDVRDLQTFMAQFYFLVKWSASEDDAFLRWVILSGQNCLVGVLRYSGVITSKVLPDPIFAFSKRPIDGESRLKKWSLLFPKVVPAILNFKAPSDLNLTSSSTIGLNLAGDAPEADEGPDEGWPQPKDGPDEAPDNPIDGRVPDEDFFEGAPRAVRVTERVIEQYFDYIKKWFGKNARVQDNVPDATDTSDGAPDVDSPALDDSENALNDARTHAGSRGWAPKADEDDEAPVEWGGEVEVEVEEEVESVFDVVVEIFGR